MRAEFRLDNVNSGQRSDTAGERLCRAQQLSAIPGAITHSTYDDTGNLTAISIEYEQIDLG